MAARNKSTVWPAALMLVLACARAHDGQKLAQTYCASCHAQPDPSLLDKKTWVAGVLPQMAPRLGVPSKTLFDQRFRNPGMQVLAQPISQADWQRIVDYYRDAAPDSLLPQ